MLGENSLPGEAVGGCMQAGKRCVDKRNRVKTADKSRPDREFDVRPEPGRRKF